MILYLHHCSILNVDNCESTSDRLNNVVRIYTIDEKKSVNEPTCLTGEYDNYLLKDVIRQTMYYLGFDDVIVKKSARSNF